MHITNRDGLARKVLLMGGGALVVYGATRRSLAGSVVMCFGGVLMGLGLSEEARRKVGQIPEKARRYMGRDQRQGQRQEQGESYEMFDDVDEANMASFPASDPPALP